MKKPVSKVDAVFASFNKFVPLWSMAKSENVIRLSGIDFKVFIFVLESLLVAAFIAAPILLHVHWSFLASIWR